MTTEEFYSKLHRRVAQVAIGASSLRNQGGGGLIDDCRNYCEKNINLADFIAALKNLDEYTNFLNNHTDLLLSRLSPEVRRWGAARKGLNLFLRDVVYNRFVIDRFSLPASIYDFNEMISPMEVPLDTDVANGIALEANQNLPKWPGIKYLHKGESDLYQIQANMIASREGIPRLHLDLKFYRA
jgi:hypothetical protein